MSSLGMDGDCPAAVRAACPEAYLLQFGALLNEASAIEVAICTFNFSSERCSAVCLHACDGLRPVVKSACSSCLSQSRVMGGFLGRHCGNRACRAHGAASVPASACQMPSTRPAAFPGSPSARRRPLAWPMPRGGGRCARGSSCTARVPSSQVSPLQTCAASTSMMRPGGGLGKTHPMKACLRKILPNQPKDSHLQDSHLHRSLTSAPHPEVLANLEFVI